MSTAGHVKLLTDKGSFNLVGKRDDWHGDKSRPFIPSDKAAESAFNQGWSVARSNVCGTCHLTKTTTGRCDCG